MTKIDQSKDKIEIKVDCRGVNCPTQLEPHYSADYVINTATPPATLGIEFNPLLSQDKKLALRTVNYESSSKVLLAFEKAFWEEGSLKDRKGGNVVTDMPMQVLYYPSVKMSTSGNNMNCFHLK